jgi:hypothetical protein
LSFPTNTSRLIRVHRHMKALAGEINEAYAHQMEDWDSNWLTQELIYLKSTLDRVAGQIEQRLKERDVMIPPPRPPSPPPVSADVVDFSQWRQFKAG